MKIKAYLSICTLYVCVYCMCSPLNFMSCMPYFVVKSSSIYNPVFFVWLINLISPEFLVVIL